MHLTCKQQTRNTTRFDLFVGEFEYSNQIKTDQSRIFPTVCFSFSISLTSLYFSFKYVLLIVSAFHQSKTISLYLIIYFFCVVFFSSRLIHFLVQHPGLESQLLHALVIIIQCKNIEISVNETIRSELTQISILIPVPVFVLLLSLSVRPSACLCG